MHFRAGQFAAAAVLVVTGLAVPAHAQVPTNHPKGTPLTEEECRKGGGVPNTTKDSYGREVYYCAGGTHNKEPLGE